MNLEPNSESRRRIAREDCEVGDWVDSANVPEWSADLCTHDFSRESISISPQATGEMGGIHPSQAEKWTFVARRRADQLVWLRER